MNIINSSVLSDLRAGQHEAYRKTYIHFRKPVEQFVFKLTGSRDSAEDIAQEVFLNLWEQRERLDPAGNIGGYLYHMTRNKVLKKLYAHKNSTEERYNENYTERIADTAGGTEGRLEAEEMELLVEIAVARMPKQRKDVFNLYRAGFSNEEIAQQLGITVANAKQHLSLARKDLREFIAFVLIIFFIN